MDTIQNDQKNIEQKFKMKMKEGRKNEFEEEVEEAEELVCAIFIYYNYTKLFPHFQFCRI